MLRGSVFALVLAIGLTGCGDDDGTGGTGGTGGSAGEGGTGGTAGTGGAAGTGGTGGVVDISDLEELNNLVQMGEPLVAEITDVTVSSPPVMSFTLGTQGGQGVTGILEVPGASVRGTFVKLVPGATANETERWESYINRIVEGGEGAELPQALQASQDRATPETLVDNGDGTYVFTYVTDVTNVTEPVPVSWEPSYTTRAGLEIRVDDLLNPDNPTWDFVPDGSAGSGEKAITTTETCNRCHDRLALHGDGRFTEDYCVTCHTLGTRDPEFGEVLDMAYMTHSIHASALRASFNPPLPFIVEGFGGTVHDYSEVTYPQDVRSSPNGGTTPCQTCHQESNESPEGNLWAETVNSTACGGCHTDRLVESDTDPETGVSVYLMAHPFTVPPQNFPDSACLQCHNNPVFDPPINTALVHEIPTVIARGAFRYEILGATNTNVGEFPSVTFRVVDPENGDAPYDLAEVDGPFDNDQARLAVMVAWPSSDYSNIDTGSEVAGFRPGSPAQNVSMDPLSLCVPPSTRCADNGDGSYTITSDVAVPEGLTGNSLTVAIEGHPGVDGLEIPVTGAVDYFAISENGGAGTPREQIVSIEKCNDCHSILSLHGNNRTDNIELCVTCHNAQATDIRARAEAGVEGEVPIHFKTMIHGIHNATEGLVIYGFGGSVHDYSEVTYPGLLYNCDSCHIESSFYPTNPDDTFRFATTFISDNFDNAEFPEEVVPTAPRTEQRAATLANQEDDFNITANAAACTSCHTGASTVSHAEIPGGALFAVKQLNDGVFLPPDAPVETCTFCHGQGSSVSDTATSHRPPFNE